MKSDTLEALRRDIGDITFVDDRIQKELFFDTLTAEETLSVYQNHFRHGIKSDLYIETENYVLLAKGLLLTWQRGTRETKQDLSRPVTYSEMTRSPLLKIGRFAVPGYREVSIEKNKIHVKGTYPEDLRAIVSELMGYGATPAER